LHGHKEISNIPRVACTLLHATFLAASAWIFFGESIMPLMAWVEVYMPHGGNLCRSILLFSFGVVLFVRMTITLFFLLKRRFAWNELGGVAFALFVYQIGFASLGAGEMTHLGFLDAAAIGLFIIGSYINTGSELQRKKFKDDPKNRGRLYTGGLFRFARHINYFGDILWVSGWAIATRDIRSALIPIGLTAGFIFAFIPSLTEHLRTTYGEQFDEWSKRTKALIPYIY
jgi:protein-S-isoprenylcysteine O-methyltransferase Ste14